jgi:hypothetical protein
MLRAGLMRQDARRSCEPRNRAAADGVNLGEVARPLALGEALPRFLDLVRIEYRLAPHLHALVARDLPAFMRPLDDPQPLLLGHRRHHRHEAAPDGRGEELGMVGTNWSDEIERPLPR